MWTLIVCLCVSSSLVMALAMCLCWRKKQQKDNDLLGLDGMVTQKNPDENVNHLPSAASCVVDGINALPAAPTADNDVNKRNVASTNTRRSLPDIPSEQGAAVNWEPTGDNSSEHYATVEQYRNAKRHTMPNGIEARPSLSQHSSMSQAEDAFSPYEKVKYDKIKSKEHPYDHLQLPSTSRKGAGSEENCNSSEEGVSLLRPDGPSTCLAEPAAPSRSRRSSAHSGLCVDIPAASAVAGGIAASPELPYMTPPVTQPNFSGDSQDSSKGYTSISVREPLAVILAQTKQMNKRDLDKHYSTVSDDSDDMYTTIPDPNNQVYTSESETYAQIPAHPITVEAEVNAPQDRFDEEVDQMYEPAPQPPLPSVDSLKQVTGHSHSRQASSSSSIANIGSPKPEKRQANSPLPPPPPGVSFDFHSEKVQVQKNLDDLYAKVHKTKKKEEPADAEKSPERKDTSTEDKKIVGSSAEHKRREHNYETLRKNRNTSDPGYEKISHEEPGYASINGPDSISSSDPGYEVLKQRPPSEVDPNYEELRHQSSNASDCGGYSKIKSSDVKQKTDEKSRASSSYEANSQDYSIDEPNYESMPSESLSSEHNYSVLKSTSSESDPNYESVNQSDPNYESVRDLDEPPYARLNDDSNSDSQRYERVSRGYENIDTSESSNGAGDTSHKKSEKADPPYEKLSNDTDSEVVGYEKISKSPPNHNNNNTSSVESASSSDKSEPNYSTVNKGDKSNVGSCSLLDENAIFQV